MSDSRSEAPPERPRSGWTLLLVPEEARRPVRELRITPSHVRRFRSLACIGVALAVLLVAGTVAVSLRLRDHSALVEENFHLRARLANIDRKMEQVDDAIRRIRLYDSQLRRLSESMDLPGRGPLDSWEYDQQEDGRPTEPVQPVADPTAFPVDVDLEGISPGDLRPAELWAQAIEARTTGLVGLVEQVEPRMSTLVQDLEDWRSVRSAYPSVWPLEGSLTSGFGYRRSPFSRRWKFHSGIDISSSRGAPILATAPGVVTFSGYNQGYGRMIEIDHGHGIKTRYAHNTAHYVREGDVVERGQRIATVGSTGRTTGPHLHFELLIDDQPVDPLDYLP